MIMHHKVFFFFYCSLFVSTYLFFLSDLSMRSLKIGSLNINGGRDRQKRGLISEISTQKNIDILFLQETHTTPSDETDWGLWWEGSNYLSHGTNFSAGVAILFRASANVKIVSCAEIVKGRLLIVRAEIEDTVFCFTNIYAPNNGAERVAFYTRLQKELVIYNQDQIILGGDFNCTLDFTVDRIGEEPHPYSSQTLNCHLSPGFVGHFRVKHPQSRQYTWVRVNSNRVCAARLDRVYISRTLNPRLIHCNILPVGFTDHHFVSVELVISPGERAKSFWHFNNKLLLDNVFCKNFGCFWDQWQLRKVEFDSLKLWWEVGKAQIRVFCQQYTSHSSARLKTVIKNLEDNIKNLEEGLNGSVDPTTGTLLKEKRMELSSFLQERVKGALVRSRFLQLKDMDAPTSFFFNLERSVAQKKLLTCLKLPGGRITADPKEMSSHAMQFYEDLFGAESCSQECRRELLEGLPQLSVEERSLLEGELSLEELTAAVTQMATGRAPGIDGLSTDFFKRFWNILGSDLHSVLMECCRTGSLPGSCKRAVLSLLPKKGDLALLKNWRPVALLCADYKILSRALSNRLKDVLGSVVHKDQSYCVPDRTIMDNVFLIRDVIDVCKIYNLNVGIVSLDQEKAFDRVDHSYLFSALRSFGFGDGFVSLVGLLYQDAQCLVKMGAGLSRPIPVRRGIRQGCPISGQLYSLAIEPLLCRLRGRLSGLSLPAACSIECPPTISAYADDVNIFISNQGDVRCLRDTLSLYERATAARVNWEKSGALLVGEWRDQAVPSLPGGLEWGREGLKVLGVYLGTEGFKSKNWEGVREKVCARLSKWKWLLPQLSYRGRVLVVNNLVASTLWHRLVALTPPRGLVEDIQRAILDFFWSGKHWVQAAVLYLPVAEGGHGLIDIQSKIASFRLQTAQRLLFTCGPSWMDIARLLLRRAGRLGYTKQLFLLKLEEVDLTGLTSFYMSVMQAWKMYTFKRKKTESLGMWIFEEPLFFNDFIRTPTLQSASLRASFREAGCTKLGHLVRLTLDALKERTNITSSRVVERVVEEVFAALPVKLVTFLNIENLCEQWSEEGEYSFPSLSVTPDVGEWQERGGGLLSFSTPVLGKFQDAGKKALYQSCVKVLHLRGLSGVKESRWIEFFGPEVSPKGSWRSLYKLPVEKRTADLQWRVVHGVIATNRYRAHIDPGVGEECLFCSLTETLSHLFVECPRLSLLFVLMKSLFEALGEDFSYAVFVFGPKYSAKKKTVHTLMNFLSGSAKLAIWLTRKNRAQGTGCVEPLLVLEGLLKARLKVEFAYYQMMDNVQDFNSVWAVEEALCSVGGDGELIIHF
uniref:Reverse transcriptase domain-containing protein n=1 Tax=Labrus bergylta TaxID=56723 RepID=A0A3Q3ERM5_9LABR